MEVEFLSCMGSLITCIGCTSVCEKDKTIITDLECGEVVCSKCGLVISDKIQDIRQEWGNFANQILD
jgi:transcription initiation factor TFIIIB Brf1 subunit/transcription initiation factor TFIIB